MLGLTEQVRGDGLGVGRPVREHGDLGGAREQVDGDRAEQLALGLGDIGVARADDHVDGWPAQQAERHGGQRLHASQDVEVVDPGQVRGVGDGVVGAAVRLRGRASHHRRDARHLGDAHGHERAGREREAPGRQIRADRTDRNVALPDQQPGGDLLLEVRQMRALERGETPGALGTEFDRLPQVLRQPVAAAGHLRRTEFDRAVGLAVQGARVAADRVHAMALDVRQHPADGLDHLGVALGRGSVHLGSLEQGESAGEGGGEAVAQFHASEPEAAPSQGQPRIVLGIP